MAFRLAGASDDPRRAEKLAAALHNAQMQQEKLDPYDAGLQFVAGTPIKGSSRKYEETAAAGEFPDAVANNQGYFFHPQGGYMARLRNFEIERGLKQTVNGGGNDDNLA